MRMVVKGRKGRDGGRNAARLPRASARFRGKRRVKGRRGGSGPSGCRQLALFYFLFYFNFIFEAYGAAASKAALGARVLHCPVQPPKIGKATGTAGTGSPALLLLHPSCFPAQIASHVGALSITPFAGQGAAINQGWAPELPSCNAASCRERAEFELGSSTSWHCCTWFV